MQATQRAPGDDLYLVTLGTPFVQIIAEKFVKRIGLLFVLLYSIPLFASALSFVYFNINDEASKAAYSALLFLILGCGFYFLLVKYEIHEVLGKQTEGLMNTLRVSCVGSSYEAAIKTLILYYESDEWLNQTKKARRRDELAKARLRSGLSLMERYFVFWNPLYIGISLFAFVVIWILDIVYLKSLAIVYGLAAFITLFLLYCVVGLGLIIGPSVKIFSGVAGRYKIFGFGMASFSPMENLLLSMRTRLQPAIKDGVTSVQIMDLKVREPKGSHHSYVALDPDVAKLIVEWVRKGHRMRSDLIDEGPLRHA